MLIARGQPCPSTLVAATGRARRFKRGAASMGAPFRGFRDVAKGFSWGTGTIFSGGTATPTSTVDRPRSLYVIAFTVVIALGLASRRYAAVIPKFIANYAGDTLWATMVFTLIGALAPRVSSLRVATRG